MEMDRKRKKALEQLEVVRPDSGDLNAPELADAIAALEDDAVGRQEFDRRQEFDGRIATVMQSVEPPAGLKEKLLAATSADVHAAPGEPKVSKPRTNRRAALISALTLCLTVAVGFALLPGTPHITYDAIVDFAPRDVETLEKLATAPTTDNQSLDLELPVWLTRMKLTPQLAWPREDSMPPDGPDEATSLVMGRTNWVLVVTPSDQIDGAPSFNNQGTLSRSLGSGVYQGAWKEEQFVYVLFVKGDKRTFDSVRNSFTGASA